MLVPGSTIGDVSQPSRCYRIVRAVGRGGMGEIYEAVQMHLRLVSADRRLELAPDFGDAGRPNPVASLDAPRACRQLL